MPVAVYVDCFSGASGDMLLGSLLDAGVPLAKLREGLESLGVGGWSLSAEPIVKHGLRGVQARVSVAMDTAQASRHLPDIQALIRRSGLPDTVQEQACQVFHLLAEAEAHVHGTTVDNVHFHEVGGVDSIVDVVGVVFGLHLLCEGPPAVFASGLPLGSGWVRSEHGSIPVPGPATLELLRLAGAPTRRPPREDEPGELTTPTGAALLASLATFKQPAFARIQSVGYGFGTREFSWPNAVRLWVGELAQPGLFTTDEIVQLETNLDDSTPEQLGYAMELLFEAGALDVAFSPLQMKKNRPGILLRVLCPPPLAGVLAELVLINTSALGVRLQSIARVVAERASRSVPTPWGEVRIKEKRIGERTFLAPEFEDCAAAARASGVPLQVVYDSARAAAGE